MPEPSRPPRVLLVLLIAVMILGWAFNFIFGKIALAHLDVWSLASFRIIVAALLMLVLYAATPGHRGFDWRDLKTFTLLGLFGVVMNQGCFSIGLNYTSVSHSSVIVALGPVLVLLLATLNGLEQMTAAKAAGTALAFGGVAVLAVENGVAMHSPTLRGDLITLAGTTGFAFYAVLGKRVAHKYDSIAMNTFNFLVGGLLALPVAIYRGVHLDWKGVGWAGWAGLFYMAAVSSVVGYVIFYWALRYISASKLSSFSYFLPLIVTLLGIVLLGERPTLYLYIGGALVLVGLALAHRYGGAAPSAGELEPEYDSF